MTSIEYITARLAAGVTIEELARELELTPRHVRRLARSGGWAPGPRRHTGPRTIKVKVSGDTYAALEARGGKSIEETAAALLLIVADKDKIAERRGRAEAGRTERQHGGDWAAGYLDALLGGIEAIK